MIVSENITLKISKPLKNKKIENALLEHGIKPLRQAIINVNEEHITISVSYEKNC